MTRSFGLTFDYRCPFSRNVHEHVISGIRAGADWDVEFLPFSLSQMHVEDGPSVWDDPAKAVTLLAPEVALVVRDKYPEKFLDVHLGLFAARFDDGRDIRERDVIADVLRANGIDDTDGVFDLVDGGAPLEEFRKTHEELQSGPGVFGVPTFVLDGRAVFVRLTHRPDGDGELAKRSIDRVLDLIDWPELNEFKDAQLPW